MELVVKDVVLRAEEACKFINNLPRLGQRWEVNAINKLKLALLRIS